MEEQNTPYANFPSLDMHLGIWEGTYRYYDATTGKEVKTHQSKLILKREHNKWIQSNIYTYTDGKVEKFDFEAKVSENRLDFSFGRVEGFANGADHENFSGYVLFYFKMKGDDVKEYHQIEQSNKEIIHLLSPTNRMRTWQLSEGGKPTMFCNIIETRDPSTIPQKTD